jgi:hypothetical protein
MLKKTCTIIAGTMLAVLIATAAFGAVGIRTKVTLSGAEARHGSKFRGMLFTMAPLQGEGDKDACLANRKVVLLKKTQKGLERAGKTVTNAVGDYKLRVGKGRQHRYVAKATRVALADRYGNLIVCEADISEVVKL